MSVEQDIYNMAMEKLAIFDRLKAIPGAQQAMKDKIRNAWRVRRELVQPPFGKEIPWSGEGRRNWIRKFNDTAADFLQARTNNYDNYLYNAPYLSKPKPQPVELHGFRYNRLAKGEREHSLLQGNAYTDKGIPNDASFLNGMPHDEPNLKNIELRNSFPEGEQYGLSRATETRSPKDVEDALETYFNGRRALDYYGYGDALASSAASGTPLPAKMRGPDDWNKASFGDDLRADWLETKRDFGDAIPKAVAIGVDTVAKPVSFIGNLLRHPINTIRHPINTFRSGGLGYWW